MDYDRRKEAAGWTMNGVLQGDTIHWTWELTSMPGPARYGSFQGELTEAVKRVEAVCDEAQGRLARLGFRADLEQTRCGVDGGRFWVRAGLNFENARSMPTFNMGSQELVAWLSEKLGMRIVTR